jgi:hypothetical protein
MRKIIIVLVLISILALAIAQRAIAQTSGPSVNIVKLTLHPVATTEPALEYPLLPPMSQRHEGNAAVSWMVVAAMMPPYSDSKDEETPLFETVDAQVNASPETFSASTAANVLKTFPFGFMDRAARCDMADWGVDKRAGIYALLPYLNHLRPVASVLALRARLNISRGDFADARQALQSGLSMSQQLTSEPILVQNLVSSGIAQFMLTNGVEPWIGGGGPNLYWSLSSLPSPLIDLSSIAQTERALLPWTDARFAQALNGTLPAEQWRATLIEMMRVGRTALPATNEQSPPDELSAFYERTKQTIYPKARQQLQLKGLSSKQIDGVPVDQAVGAFMVAEYQTRSDDAWKAWSLPYRKSVPILDQNWRELKQGTNDGNALLSFIPNLSKTRATFARLEQHIAVLRVIEALRDYAARYGGLLPKSLDQVVDLPLPNDPVTDQAFNYHLDGQNDGKTATIEPAPLSAFSQQVKYELTIAPTGQSITAPAGM